MAGIVRWQFVDPTNATTYKLHINPNAMSTPWLSRQTQTMVQSGPGGTILALQAPPIPSEWTFGGVIRSEDHYDALLLWSQKDYPIQVIDHYTRPWSVLITAFEPEDRKPLPLVPWRLKYTMRALMLSGS